MIAEYLLNFDVAVHNSLMAHVFLLQLFLNVETMMRTRHRYRVILAGGCGRSIDELEGNKAVKEQIGVILVSGGFFV